MNPDQEATHRDSAAAPGRHELPDHRDERVVGGDKDSVLETLGKAIVAPFEGATENPEPPHRQPGESPPR